MLAPDTPLQVTPENTEARLQAGLPRLERLVHDLPRRSLHTLQTRLIQRVLCKVNREGQQSSRNNDEKAAIGVPQRKISP